MLICIFVYIYMYFVFLERLMDKTWHVRKTASHFAWTLEDPKGTGCWISLVSTRLAWNHEQTSLGHSPKLVPNLPTLPPSGKTPGKVWMNPCEAPRRYACVWTLWRRRRGDLMTWWALPGAMVRGPWAPFKRRPFLKRKFVFPTPIFLVPCCCLLPTTYHLLPTIYYLLVSGRVAV